ncbi:MAG TPA: dTMP kinase [Planctomycetota bacterium]|nr:dTMP kinase [Planctomycetota bacterium]
MSEARPVFVVLDGIDGCGKTTQARLLAKALSTRRGREAVHLREPGSTPLGERIRELVLSREFEIASASETLLFAAARRALLDQRVAPALASGSDVVCERFHASTFAYQSVAGNLDEAKVLDLLHTWAGKPAPDLTVILDLEPRAALARRKTPGDRIEDRGLAFQEAVAMGYRRYAKLDPLARLVDADAAEELVAERVLACLETLFAKGVSRG